MIRRVCMILLATGATALSSAATNEIKTKEEQNIEQLSVVVVGQSSSNENSALSDKETYEEDAFDVGNVDLPHPPGIAEVSIFIVRFTVEASDLICFTSSKKKKK